MTARTTDKRYEIARDNGVVKVIVVADGRAPYELPHVVLHSPPGMEYGHGGSGPSDLALSITADLYDERPTASDLITGRSRGWLLHHRVLWRFVAPLEQHVRMHVISGGDLLAFCEDLLEPCAWCEGTGRDPWNTPGTAAKDRVDPDEGWCLTCGLPKARCRPADADEEPHDFDQAPCADCVGLTVRIKRAVVPC